LIRANTSFNILAQRGDKYAENKSDNTVLTLFPRDGTVLVMDDGHFFSFATVALAITLIFVLALGGLFIYLFLTKSKENK
jgi:hypothetical protein